MIKQFSFNKWTMQDLYQLIRFGIVGVGATLVHVGVALLLKHMLLADEQGGFFLIPINIAAFLVAFAVSFLGHYHWTFEVTGSKKRSLIRFFVVAVAGLCASSVVLAQLVVLDLGGDFTKLIISVFVVPLVSYFLGRVWAFK